MSVGEATDATAMRRRVRSWLSVCVCAGAGVLLLIPMTALAESRVRIVGPPGAGFIKVVGSAGDDRIRAGWSRELRSYVIRDRGGVDSADCAEVSPRQVRCKTSGYYFDIRSAAGDDRVSLGEPERSSFGPQLAGVTGGAGRDRILGSNANDLLNGGPGRDLIRGRGGNDSVSGGDARSDPDRTPSADLLYGGRGNDDLGGETDSGADLVVGGPGDDRIHDADRRAAKRLNGGPGKDACRVDRGGLDPEPVQCELLREGPSSLPFRSARRP